MKKVIAKKEYFIIVIIMLLFVSVSYLSLTSIHQLRGNARVINYVGIVRGATQKLVKKEMYSYPDDALITRLDSIVTELITGNGPNNLVVLQDEVYLNNMMQVRQSWNELKSEIQLVRQGAGKDRLFELSENYFVLVDRTVSSAELFSEQQVSRSTSMLIGVNIVFVGLMAVGFVMFLRSASLKRRADTLGKIAYVDPLTQMPNRAACEREVAKYTDTPPGEDVAIFMFDMNSLKQVNDILGHQGGDRIIADFARVLRSEVEGLGFVGRYGGDEFLAILPNGSDELANSYLTRINEKIVAYNLLHINALEKISFAAGYMLGNLQNMTIDSMINEADRRMYTRKRQMKENKED